MILCSNGHDEVCYEVRCCPVCELMAEKDGLEQNIYNLIKEVGKLERAIESLNEQIDKDQK